ncbi:MAG: DUF1467 family protein [Sphingopyxis sp.]
MQWTSALAIYFLFWFLCLFFVLPFHGRRSDGRSAGRDEIGHDRGAPPRFRVLRAFAQVTLLSAILFGAYYAAYVSGLITRDTLNIFGRPPG